MTKTACMNEILDTLKFYSLGITDIENACGYARKTTRKYVQLLEQEGKIIRDPKTKLYSVKEE